MFSRVPSLSGLLPPSPTAPGSGCPQLHQPAATDRRQGLSPRPNQQRLVAHLRVDEQIRVAALQRPLPKRSDLLVEQPRDPRHLRLADAQPEALDELIDAPGRD